MSLPTEPYDCRRFYVYASTEDVPKGELVGVGATLGDVVAFDLLDVQTPGVTAGSLAEVRQAASFYAGDDEAGGDAWVEFEDEHGVTVT